MPTALLEQPPLKIEYRSIKIRLHTRLLEEIDVESLNRLTDAVAHDRVRQAVRDMLGREKAPLTLPEREQMVIEIIDELFGFGPLESLLSDPTVSDILVNGPNRIYVERQGVLERTDVQFDDEAHLMRIIERIVSRVGRRVDES